MTSVWVVDDHAVIRQGLKQILVDDGSEFKVTEDVGSVDELLNLLKNKAAPEAIVLDLSMPGKSGLEAINEIKVEFPNLPILILSIHPEDQYATRCLKAGASGYLSKECAPEQLVQALKSIVKGERYITNRVASLIADKLASALDKEPSHTILSNREFEIMLMLSQGKTLTEIGETLSLSIKTISTYRTRVMKKMNFNSNADLIKYVLKNGLNSNTSF